MAVTIRGGDILFNDGTTQSSAGMAVPSGLTSIGGELILCRTTTNNMVPGQTVSGSYMFYATAIASTGSPFYPAYNSVPFDVRNRTTSFSHNGQTYVPIGVGTWMLVGASSWNPGCNSDGYGNYLLYQSLWRRIA